MAIAAMKRWAAGRGHVSPKVQAAAAAAVAQWEAMKATTASGSPGLDSVEEDDLPTDIDEHASVLEHSEETEMTTLHDGIYEEVVDDSAELATTLLAGGVPLNPPTDWFRDPQLGKPTPFTLDPDGRVYGHIAAWDVDHIGIPGSRKPPHSMSDYAFFKTGMLSTADGDNVPVGQVTFTGGHAPLSADAGSAVKHYDDTASAFADVNVGEDAHGIWVAGAVRPGVTEEQIRAIRASAPSGDWRPINGNLELVACCQVNVPGFPVVRSMVASGEVVSLVAAGAAPLYELRQEQGLIESLQRVENSVTRMQDALVSRGLVSSSFLTGTGDDLDEQPVDSDEAIDEAADETADEAPADDTVTDDEVTDAQLMEWIDEAVTAAAPMNVTNTATRKKLAKKGHAMPHGGYPIPNVEFLKKAIQAIGRAKDPAATRRFIIKRAKQLGAMNLVPDSWNANGSTKSAVTAALTAVESMHSRRDEARRMRIEKRAQALQKRH